MFCYRNWNRFSIFVWNNNSERSSKWFNWRNADILMGAVAGLMEAQYNLLRKKGHSPSEAFNENSWRVHTELDSAYRWKWRWTGCMKIVQQQHNAEPLTGKEDSEIVTAPLFDELYESVASGKEAEITIKAKHTTWLQRKTRKRIKNTQRIGDVAGRSGSEKAQITVNSNQLTSYQKLKAEKVKQKGKWN